MLASVHPGAYTRIQARPTRFLAHKETTSVLVLLTKRWAQKKLFFKLESAGDEVRKQATRRQSRAQPT